MQILMSLLSRYVCRIFAQYFGLGLSICAGLFFLIVLFDRIDNFIDYQAYWVDMIYDLWLRLPNILYLMVLIACLLASVLTFSTLNKHNEIMAMRTAGVAPLRLAKPLFGLEVVACCLLLAMQDTPQHFTERWYNFPERPAEISALSKEPEEMGLSESLVYARQSQRQGLYHNERRYLVAFHGKLVFAAVCIILMGFGVPLALTSNRSGGMARATALTMDCGFSYWILHSLTLALGLSVYLPPISAAWMGNISFDAGSLYLTVQAQ